MPIAPGTRLGHYEIATPLGAGGMGDVYKARDTRLDRLVALKISKEQFTPRFETEARATAALEHPHICRLYDVCHEDGASFLVMEYVEGKPLTGPLPLDQVLAYAGQIADALDEAHRKQIVHRDLKPSNILITPKGGVKLLDFGLAKLGSSSTPLDDQALTRGLTAAGTILGTLHYMSPEQLQGGVADARSDIFGFGLVLYEMLTGKRAFDGASAASVIAAILERPAPSVNAVAPSSLDRLLQRCLAKDPDERWQSARDVKAALDLIVEPAIAVQRASPRSAGKKTLWPWLAVAVMAVGLAALAFVHFRETLPRSEPVTFHVTAPEDRTINSAPFLSPDGRSLAFIVVSSDGVRTIAVRTFGSLTTRVLPGTENAGEHVVWSPDSRFIAFAADRTLKTLDLAGGVIRTVCDVGAAIGGGAWNADGTIIFSAFQKGLLQVSARGGVPAQLSTPGAGEIHVMPSFLPDGRRFLYIAIETRERKAEVRLATLDGPAIHRLPLDDGGRVLFTPSPGDDASGHLLFVRGTTLVGQPVDVTTFAAVGEPVVVADDVGGDASNAPGAFSVTASGALAYLSGDLWQESQLTWFTRDGAQLGVVGPVGKYNDLSLSPDEMRLAVTEGESTNGDIWLIDLARENARARFTSDPAQDWHPVWSPDGLRVAFSSTRLVGLRQNALFWKDAANVSNEELILAGAPNQRLNDWSPDGKLLLVAHTSNRGDLWILPVAAGPPNGERKAEPYLQSVQFAEARGQFYPLPDPAGRYWIAYSSDETGQSEIYVESYPRGAPRVPISTGGGMQPRWRRDGRELFYLSRDRKLMSVDVTMGKQLEFGVPRLLFQTRVTTGSTDISRVLRYDVTRDGKRFLINSELENAKTSSAPITVVLNWASALSN